MDEKEKVIDKTKAQEALYEKELKPFHCQLGYSKDPPYTEEEIEEMLQAVANDDIQATTSSCYSVPGGNTGTACGSCCV